MTVKGLGGKCAQEIVDVLVENRDGIRQILVCVEMDDGTIQVRQSNMRLASMAYMSKFIDTQVSRQLFAAMRNGSDKK